jgi:outer membrane protein assembly factor BamA
LATYSLSGRDTTKWINRMLRSIGEAPVLYDSASTRRSMADLQMQLVNMGYLRASVDAMTKSKKKKVDVTYFLHPGQPYYIRHVDYVVQDSAIASHLRLDLEQNRQLKQGMLFSVANLDGERKRITQ